MFHKLPKYAFELEKANGWYHWKKKSTGEKRQIKVYFRSLCKEFKRAAQNIQWAVSFGRENKNGMLEKLVPKLKNKKAKLAYKNSEFH